MHFLILCILSSTGIFIVFKSIDRFRLPSLPVIVINYLTATLLGLVITSGRVSVSALAAQEWFPISVVIGVLFIVMFFLVAYSSRKAGISITTVASKMSVIFPIVFSMIIDPSDRLTVLKGAAIICTLVGVALTVYQPKQGRTDWSAVYIPLILFAGMGLVDSLVKFAQHRFVTDAEVAPFSTVLFFNAFISGLIAAVLVPGTRKSFRRLNIWGWGVLLGSVNFGSVFFLVRALNHLQPGGRVMDSSVIFGINNIGIVTLCVLAGLMIFREKLRALNWAGIGLSAIALILFMFGR